MRYSGHCKNPCSLSAVSRITISGAVGLHLFCFLVRVSAPQGDPSFFASFEILEWALAYHIVQLHSMNSPSLGAAQDKVLLVPADYVAEGVYSDQRYRLASFFFDMTARSKHRRRGKRFTFSSDEYRAMFGSVGSAIVKRAEADGLIERTKHSAGSHACKARLTEKYRDGRFRAVEIGRKNRSKDTNAPCKPLDEVSGWLLGNLGRFALPVSPRFASDWDAYLAYQFSIGRHRVIRDSTGRRHNSLTPMSRVLRSQFTLSPVGGENSINVQHIEKDGSAYPCSVGFLPAPGTSSPSALWEVDVKTCQPLLIGAGALNESVKVRSDVYYWLELCQCADLYSFFLNAIQKSSRCALTRLEVKKETMVATFGTTSQSLKTNVGRLIQSRFPSIWRFIESLKKGDHRKAARFAQGEESRLMIDGAAGSLMRSYRDLPIATVHDAIICALYHLQPVVDAILAAFAPYGVVPQLEKVPLVSIGGGPTS